MEKEIIIEANNLELSFHIQRKGINNIKNFILSLGFSNLFEKIEVLKGLDLKIYKGECLGLLGLNGCGKSTFLRSVAGIMKPSGGTLIVNGQVAPLMALGAGLEPELTGLENIKLISRLMGKSKKQINESIDSIIEFSELSIEAINMEVKRYSQGMIARLAFSTSVASTPDILIIDEALTVGDLGFQKKCANRIEEIKKAGSTIIYVSHNTSEIERICNRAVYMANGVIEMEGEVNQVIEHYKSESSKLHAERQKKRLWLTKRSNEG